MRAACGELGLTCFELGSGAPILDDRGLNRLLDLLAEEGGPLEQFDVNQLSLVGVVWHAASARALVQDPSGMSYIVAEGARIGKNDGRVMRIDDNLMVVKETYEDWQGQETTKDIEMRIRATEGG